MLETEARMYNREVRKAVRGIGGVTRESKQLDNALRLGPMADFRFFALTRALSAIRRWLKFKKEKGGYGEYVEGDTSATVDHMMNVYGWRRDVRWSWTYGHDCLNGREVTEERKGSNGKIKIDLESSDDDFGAALHALRTSWRRTQVKV